MAPVGASFPKSCVEILLLKLSEKPHAEIMLFDLA
jgi:hypothetical protein